MKHLSTAALALSVAVVAAAAIAQTRPPESPASQTPSRRQSGTVGTSPDAAPTPNAAASQGSQATQVAPSGSPGVSPGAGQLTPADASALPPALGRRHDRN
ncbi:hypothetical protein [Roseateles depolymerans]|uniref:Uncharacterized protein n=1 Tax=Roseateles depolymerans TaxID=76731 RepID=A0A0U3N464_9BURK|nr:hypothetical protein [Roseateles depolymerans]ALV07003.1 hypothetical protein RD2015_2537 [Roseateles depolymerans]REG19985.1 hypothetical protein DES44_2491 [Roseateles depolymerans]